MILTELAKEKLQDEQVKMKVAVDLKISYASIYRWIKSNDLRLTTIVAIDSIIRHTGLKREELFEAETETA